MIANIVISFIVLAVLISVGTFVSLRRLANGPVFPYIAPQAGYDPPLWAVVYWAGKLFFALAPSISILILTEGQLTALAAVLAAVVGYSIPDLWILMRRSARKARIERSLSFFVDLLVSLLRAGLPVEEAFARAGARGLQPSHPLSEEVVRTAGDLGAGVDRSEAYRGFVNRTGVNDVRPLAAALDLGGKLGFGVADILAAQADVLRDKRLENGRMRIDRAMIAALFPVMLCGLPLLLVVVILPVAIDIGNTFKLIRELF